MITNLCLDKSKVEEDKNSSFKESIKNEPKTDFKKIHEKGSPNEISSTQESGKKKRKSEKEFNMTEDMTNNKNRSENKGGSNNETHNPNDTPNPLRDQTPSQLTANHAPSPEEIEEQKIEEDKKPAKIKFPMTNTDLLSQDMNK
jgi:hypothetical protein